MGDAAAAASRRLHPLTPFARGWKIIAVAIAFAGQEAAFDLDATRFLAGLAIIVPVAALYGVLSWWFTRYVIDGGDLRLETGVVFRRTRHVRLERLQTVDVVRPLAARFLGLAELRLEVAGGTSSEAPLAYLAEPDARRLRAELLARAAGVAPEAEEAPERVLVRVPTSALAKSIALSAGTVVAVLFGVLLVVIAVVLRQPAVVFPLLPTVLGVAAAVSRSFTSNFDFTVAESPDGLRLRHGLLEQRSQTLPPGRIQAVRLVEPPLWRLLDQRRGWVKVEVNVAGYGGQGLEEGQRASVLLP
ncbi:MAG: PH domain-containing protein, partial [Streptomycetales bacterium]